MKKTVKLGVCPIGKFAFSHQDAVRQKKSIFKKLDEWNVNYCTIDTVLPDGMVRDQKHVEPVVSYFKQQQIDALFVPHCNFGTEGAVGMIAKLLEVPVLLWGPRDGAPLNDGSRLRDSLCGMFASSKVLYKLHVPFTYIENCSIDDAKFKDGVSLFLRAARVAKAMKNMKIAQIGTRVDFFWTTIDNESELLEKFGVQVLPIDIAEFINNTKSRAKKDRAKYQNELVDIKKWLITDVLKDDEGLINSLAMRDELLSIKKEENIDAFSIKSFNSIPYELGEGNGLGDALVQEQVPVAAESDIHGAISSVLLEAAASTDQPSFFPEYTIRHPEDDNGILLWHASAPPSLRDAKYDKVKILPPWILKDLPATSLQFKLKDGPLTCCRFDGDFGQYRLGIGEGVTMPGPQTREVYVWMKVSNWPRWERKLMEGPYIHHCSCIYEHCADVLEEACKYIPGLKSERLDR